MNITIVGAGNVGTLVAGVLTRKGNKVTIYTRDKSRWGDEITVYDKDTESEYKYVPYKITEDICEAVSNASMIFVTLPSFAINNFILSAKEYIKSGTIIGFYPGTGGVEFASNELLNKGCIIFGTQRICSVVRLKEYGHYVVTAGKRKDIYLGAIPSEYTASLCETFKNLFDIATHPLPNYLNVTLTPSNPILHPSRLYTLYKDYNQGVVYENVPLFYEDWTDETSKLLIACDDELHKILDKLDVDTINIRPLLEHYESTNYKEMTNKIRSIASFKGIKSPYIETENGCIPDLANRYFMADIPYGLIIIKDFAIICNVDTPNIDKIIAWYQKITGKKYIDLVENKLDIDAKNLLLPELFGINSIKDICEFYTKR